MTPLLRPSTETKIEATGLAIARILVGLAIAGLGAFFDFLEYKEPTTHTTHLAIFTGILLLGLLTAFAGLLFPVIKQVIVIAGPYLPVIGGRRAGDPPAPPAGGAP